MSKEKQLLNFKIQIRSTSVALNFKLQIRSTSEASNTQISNENNRATTRVAPTISIHGHAQLNRGTPEGPKGSYLGHELHPR